MVLLVLGIVAVEPESSGASSISGLFRILKFVSPISFKCFSNKSDLRNPMDLSRVLCVIETCLGVLFGTLSGRVERRDFLISLITSVGRMKRRRVQSNTSFSSGIDSSVVGTREYGLGLFDSLVESELLMMLGVVVGFSFGLYGIDILRNSCTSVLSLLSGCWIVNGVTSPLGRATRRAARDL